MIRHLTSAAALCVGLAAQSPLESTFTPAPGTVVTNTQNPITGLFDITVTEPQGIVLTQIDLQVNTAHGTNGMLGVWLTAPGVSHVGNETIASAWTQVSSAMTVHQGGRVSFQLLTPIPLAPATYGMALHCIQANPVYHGAAVSPTLPQIYSNNELSIDLSAARFRISDPVDPFGATALGFSPRQPAIGLIYTVGSTTVDFTATPTAGGSPLPVQFTAIATSSTGIQNYLWDFDNDGNVDSVAQNPLFTYTQCGSFSVSLTILDGVGIATTATKLDYIVTDVVTPRFTNELLGPNTVQFTDTSTPTPTSWDWDLDGDGISDSNAQNPIFVYPAGCQEVTVSLTVARNCQPAVNLTRPIAVATSIESTFQGGLITVGGAASSANYFDVDVANPLGVTICSMHVNTGVAAGGLVTVNIYQKENTYVGATDDASLWRLVGSETVTAAAGRTFVPFSTPIHLAFGQHGICMEHLGASPVYTNLGAIQVYSNADLTLTAGLTQGDPVFDPASTTWSPRIANVALHYATSQTTGAAGYGFIGPGCAGTIGIPTNVAGSQPVIGASATILVDNLPLGVGVVAIGVSRLTPPVDLAIIGMPGCPLYSSAEFLGAITGVGTSASFNLPVPNNATLIGSLLFTQCAGLDPGLNALGLSASDGAVLLIGQ